MNERTHVDLFTGIGGFSLAAKANGVRTVAMCEADAHCQAFLDKAWPGVQIWPDVRTFSLANTKKGARVQKPRRGAERRDAAGWDCGGNLEHPLGGAVQRIGERGVLESEGQAVKTETRQRERGRNAAVGATKGSKVWLLTAGVPCQPASRAGKQRGAADDRWLWPAALSVFAAIRPAWAIFENPAGIGDVGLAGILSQVEAQNYSVRVFSIPACAVGAPHRRERYWIVCRKLADAGQAGREVAEWTSAFRQPGQAAHGPVVKLFKSQCNPAHTPERGQRTDGSAPGETGHAEERGEWRAMQAGGAQGPFGGSDRPTAWSNYVWLPCADGKVRRAPDDSFGLVNGLHRSILGALGNSIVPQVAAQIIAAMIQSEEQT